MSVSQIGVAFFYPHPDLISQGRPEIGVVFFYPHPEINFQLYPLSRPNELLR